MAERTGVCIVGCGKFAHAHGRAAQALRDRIALFFASRFREKAQEYARTYGADGAFGSYEEAVRDDRVQGLVFVTPHHLHPENLELAAEHGKHVLMEKPVANTLEDARRMKERADEAGIVFVVAENYRYVPVVLKAVEMVRQGAIGELRTVHLTSLRFQRPIDWRRSREMMGGGAFVDGGIHYVAALRMTAGDPLWVSAVTPAKVFPEMEGEEAIAVTGQFHNGVVGTILYSWAVAGPAGGNSFLATGTDGYIAFEFGTDRLRLYTRSRDTEETVTVQGDPRGLVGEWADFLDAIEGKAVPRSTPEEATRDLRFVLACYRSAREGGVPVAPRGWPD